MARLSIEQLITTPSTLNYLAESAYDYTKWNLGKGIVYDSTQKTMKPIFDAIRPLEESTSFAAALVFAINYSPTIEYIFGIENSTGATATRRVHMWTYNKKTMARSWNGFITLTLATATAHTVRSFKIDYKTEATGQASCATTTVTGVGNTSWITQGVAIGARIGFGSSDPKQITTWYRITAVGASSLTLATSAGTVAQGAYVIEEFRPVYVATNATTTNGGIHLGKGITPEDFTSGGTTISLAVSADGAKAVYWLKDNITTQTNIVSAGAAIDFASATATSLTMYVLDLVAAGNYKFYTYNLRAALTVTTGATASAWLLATGNNPFTGTGSQNDNLTIATTAHGTGNGVKSLYMVTTTRVYRVPVTQIVSTSTTVFSAPSDNISEIPPGGITTYVVTGALTSIEYIGVKDKFLISTTGAYNYFTQYVNSGVAFDEIWGRDDKALDQSTMSGNVPKHISINGTAFSFHDSDNSGLVYMCKVSTTAGIGIVYIVNIGAHWDDSGDYCLFSPEITTTNALKYYRAFANHIGFLGSQILGSATEPMEIYARTTNIRVNATSSWVMINEDNDVSGLSGAATIQFKVEWRTLGSTSIPAPVYGINLSYEDNTTDSHYAASVTKSSTASKQFGFWFKTAFGTAVPTLYIRLYDADTGGLLLTDNTATPTLGSFEKTTDGTTWGSYNTTDRGNAITYIRYTPTSIADNIKVAAYISQL